MHVNAPVHPAASWHAQLRSRFLTRDPLEAETGAPYSYAGSDPLDFGDPTGLDWGWNPISDIKQAAGDVAGAAGDAGNWATTTIHHLPNSRFITGTINIAYGVYKVQSGAILIVAETAADVTGVGAALGIPAQAYGVYQVTTGTFRIIRGYHQIQDASQHPWVCKTPLQYAGDIGLDLAPGGGKLENLLGGLP